MKGITLKNDIVSLRGEQTLELVDRGGVEMTMNCDDNGWNLYTESGSIIVHFDDVECMGDDLWLVRQTSYGDTMPCAFIAANLWEVNE